MSHAFKKLDNGEIVIIGYQRINFQMIFEVKMEDFRSKASLVAGVHVKEPPATIVYAGVVLREKFRNALMLAALNELPVK